MFYLSASACQGSLHRCHQQLGAASFSESLGRSRVTQGTFPLLLMPTMLDRRGTSVPKSFQSGGACAGFCCGCARRWVRAFHTRFKQYWLHFRLRGNEMRSLIRSFVADFGVASQPRAVECDRFILVSNVVCHVSNLALLRPLLRLFFLCFLSFSKGLKQGLKRCLKRV